MALGVSRNLIVSRVYIDTLATDEHRRGCLEVQTGFPTTGSRCGWRDAFADIFVYQRDVETLDGVEAFVVYEVGHTAVVLAVFVGAEQAVVGAEPVVVVLVNTLAADFQLHRLQHLLGGVESGTREGLGEHKLDHDVGDEITVAGDLGGYLTAKVDTAVDRLLDGLHGEVGVPSVHRLEEGDLRVTGQVHVLSSVRY